MKEERCKNLPSRMEEWKRSELLTLSQLRELSTKNFYRVAALIGLDFLIIIASGCISMCWESAIVYVIAVMTIGARQIGIVTIVLHDGVHGLLAKNRRLNDCIGTVLYTIIAFPIKGISFLGFRESHLYHHRHICLDGDPDLVILQSWYQKKIWKRIVFLIFSLSGLVYLYTLNIILKGKANPFKIYFVFIYLLIFVSALYGFIFSIILIKYWIVPFITWGMFINSVRVFAEHDDISRQSDSPFYERVFCTRDTLPSLFDYFFVSTRGINYHLTHHIFPTIPFFNLKKANKIISKSALYQEHARVSRGYHRTLMKIVFPRRTNS